MSAAAETRPGRHAVTALRWAVCFGLVLGVHLGVAVLLLRHVAPPDEQPAGAPPADAVMLDLPAEAAAPPANPTPPSEPQPPPEPPAPPPTPEPQPLPAPPVPQPSVPAPVPPEPTQAAPVPEPAPAPPPQASAPVVPEPPPPPPPRPAVRPPEHPPQPNRPVPPRRSAPRQEVVREPRSDQTVAPSAPQSAPAPAAPTAAAPSSSSVASWRSELIHRLQQAKRYPEAAREREEQGVATIRFTMDRNGHILSVDLVRSSGSATLDQEAVAMIRRAEPLPALPAGVGRDTLSLTVPVTFSLR